MNFTVYADQAKELHKEQKGVFIHIPRTGGTTVYRHTGRVAPRMFWRHGSAWAIKEQLNEEWDNLFTFTFVRNPWERLGSWYLRSKEMTGYKESFKKILQAGLFVVDNFHSKDLLMGDGPISQKKYLTNKNGKVLVNFIGQLEYFDNDFKHICDILGIQNHGWGKFNARNYNYRSLYDDETIDIVKNYCKWEIEKFNYTY